MTVPGRCIQLLSGCGIAEQLLVVDVRIGEQMAEQPFNDGATAAQAELPLQLINPLHQLSAEAQIDRPQVLGVVVLSQGSAAAVQGPTRPRISCCWASIAS